PLHQEAGEEAGVSAEAEDEPGQLIVVLEDLGEIHQGISEEQFGHRDLCENQPPQPSGGSLGIIGRWICETSAGGSQEEHESHEQHESSRSHFWKPDASAREERQFADRPSLTRRAPNAISLCAWIREDSCYSCDSCSALSLCHATTLA